MSPSTRRKTGSKRVVFEDTDAAMIAPSRALGYVRNGIEKNPDGLRPPGFSIRSQSVASCFLVGPKAGVLPLVQ